MSNNTVGSATSLGPVDFLIITALPEERDALLGLLVGFGLSKIGDTLVYYSCSLPTSRGSYSIAVTQLPRMGNVEASIHATQAIAELKPTCVLMVGIAGGIRGRVRLGDVLVSTQVFYYELARQTPHGTECRPLSLIADHLLLHNAQNSNDASWVGLITARPRMQKDVESPRVHFGPFAVGDKIVADRRFISELLKLCPKLIGIEMESYGIASAAACAPDRPRFLAIRGVSDYADEHKDDSCRQLASAAAAAFTISFLRAGPIPPADRCNAAMRGLPEPSGLLIALRHLSMQYIPPQAFIPAIPATLAGRGVAELLIDQTDLYVNGRLVDPLEAAERQTHVVRHIDALLRQDAAASLAYWGIAHIPLLFHLGFQLTNKRKLYFFEINRYSGRWEHLKGNMRGPVLKLDGLPRRANQDHGDIVLRISISDTVRAEDVSKVVSSPIGSIHLYLAPPTRDVLVSEQQLFQYGTRFRQVLDRILELFPNRQRTHVFYAGPVSLAVYFGQLISQSIDRRIVVHNYSVRDSPRYSWGLEITARTDDPGFVIQSSEKRSTEGM